MRVCNKTAVSSGNIELVISVPQIYHHVLLQVTVAHRKVIAQYRFKELKKLVEEAEIKPG